MRRAGDRALGLAVVLVLVACGTTGPVSWFDLADLAAASDAGSGPDAAVDGGAPADAAGLAADSGEPMDAGTMLPKDAGQEQQDAGPGAKDAGEPGDASVCQPSFPGIGQVPQACLTCAESSCPMQVSAVESECSTYSQCVCGCNGDQRCVNGCQMDVTGTCQNALQPVEQCALMACQSECGMMMMPPPPDGGMVGLDAGDPCSTLSACCSTLPGMYQTLCENIAGRGNEGQCSMVLSQAQGQGYCQ